MIEYKAEGFDDAAVIANMEAVPVNFNKEHKAMLGHCKMILEDEQRKIAINPDKFDKLITALRTAVDVVALRYRSEEWCYRLMNDLQPISYCAKELCDKQAGYL